VQIKMTAGRRVGMYSNCERLVVLQIVDVEHAEILYDGPGGPAWEKAGNKQKNGQSCVALSTLRALRTRYAFRGEEPPATV
jgi:hypothetical protein